MVSRLDKLISYLSPELGRKRQAHRRAMEVVGKRNYESANTGRINSGWFAPTGDPDSMIRRSAQPLRDRARDSVRNSPIMAQAVTVHADNLVGTGIKPRAVTGSDEMDRRVNQLFQDWTEGSDPGGEMNWYGQQYLACRTMIEAGEVFARARTRRMDDGLEVPLQIQLLEPEFCDASRNELTESSRNTVSGIQFDRIGRRVAYWMWKNHPHNASWTAFTNAPSLVPANEVAHLYEPQRTQVRGVSWLAPVLNNVRNLEDYELAENVRKKIEACYVGIIIPGDRDDEPLAGGLEDDLTDGDVKMTDMNGNPFERFEPGMFGVAHGGKDIKFNNPALTQGLEGYIRTRLRAIAAGMRMPYELLTGDFSQSNYASGRMGILEYRRFVRAFQQLYFVPQFCAPTTRWWVERAKWGGAIPRDLVVRWEYQLPAFEAINPVDDAKADLMDWRMGKRSPLDIIGSTGRDPVRVLDEIAEFNKMAEDRGIILDSNPAKVTISGQFQMEPSEPDQQEE